MQFWSSLFLLFTCLLFWTCGNPSSPTNDETSIDGKINYTYLSAKFCDCAQASIELNHDLEQLKNEQKLEELMERLPEAEKTFKEVVACSEDALLNHSSEKLNVARIKSALGNTCQNLAPKLIDDLIAELPK